MKENKSIFKESIFSFILIVSLSVYFICAAWFYLSSFTAAHKVNENQNCEYLRIKIYGSSSTADGNTVSGSFSIIDTNGNEIAVIERSWTGSYLAVEFIQSDFNGKYFFFPSRIYGKNRIVEGRQERKKGIALEKYYNDDGQCMLLGFGSNLKERKAMYRLAVFASRKYPFFTFGINKSVNIDLSACKTNRYYSIQSDEAGRLLLVEI